MKMVDDSLSIFCIYDESDEDGKINGLEKIIQ